MATGELALAFSAQEGLSLAIVFTTFLFGLRHGIDWDHIAAITDITGSQETARKSPRFATLHAVGLGLVVLALGLLTIELGVGVPSGVDAAMERVVGLTLLLLGVYVFYSLQPSAPKLAGELSVPVPSYAAKRSLKK